jgi:hypothetical protein
MEFIKDYFKKRQEQFDNLVAIARTNNIEISINEKSIKLDAIINELKSIFNKYFSDINVCNNGIEIKNSKYNVAVIFYPIIVNNKIDCSIELKIKYYHTLCRYSKDTDYIFKKYNYKNITDDYIINDINITINKINSNYVFCDCNKL